MKLTRNQWENILKEAGIEMGKVYTDKDRPPFKVNEFKSFNDRFRNMDTIKIKDKREHQRIMKYLDKKGWSYMDIGYGNGEWHIQFDNTKEAMIIRRELEKKRFKIIDPNTNEGKLTEGSYKFVKGKYIQFPDGELTSIPGEHERDAIMVYVGRDLTKIYKQKGKIYIDTGRYDHEVRNGNELVKWLKKNKAKYVGIDDRH